MPIDEAPRCTPRFVVLLMVAVLILCFAGDRLNAAQKRHSHTGGTNADLLLNCRGFSGRDEYCATAVNGTRDVSMNTKCYKTRHSSLLLQFLELRDVTPPFGSVSTMPETERDAILKQFVERNGRYALPGGFDGEYSMFAHFMPEMHVSSQTLTEARVIELQRNLTDAQSRRLSWKRTVQAYLDAQSSIEMMLPSFAQQVAAIVQERKTRNPRRSDNQGCDVLNVIFSTSMSYSLGEIADTRLEEAHNLYNDLRDAHDAIRVRVAQLLSAEPDKYGQYMNMVRFVSKTLPVPYLQAPISHLDSLTTTEKMQFAARSGVVWTEEELPRPTVDDYAQRLCGEVTDVDKRKECLNSCTTYEGSQAVIGWLARARFRSVWPRRDFTGINSETSRVYTSTRYESITPEVLLRDARGALDDCLHWSENTIKKSETTE